MPRMRTPPFAYCLFSRPVLRAVLGWDRRTRDMTWVRPGPERVVEVGAGGGFYTHHLQRRVGKGATVIVTDPSRSAVASLCARLCGEVVGVSADGLRLPFPSCSIDVLFYGYCLEEFHDPFTGIREAARVLRPGGQLVLFLWRPMLHGRRRRMLLEFLDGDFVLEQASGGPQNIRRSYRRR
jgi:ubiquinone/menaquinone biosynthesis C-methylase UbiE